jgi:Na+-transporting NADH:ubiquinone oxidoreductase subunit NqrC
VLVCTSLACCVLVAASFAMFARDQMAGASQHQQNEIIAGAPTTTGSVPVHKVTAQPRRFIDAAAKDLTAPFHAIVQSDSQWVMRGVPTIIALLAYGVGFGYLARFSRGMS